MKKIDRVVFGQYQRLRWWRSALPGRPVGWAPRAWRATAREIRQPTEAAS
jgi:hypothetical protein